MIKTFTLLFATVFAFSFAAHAQEQGRNCATDEVNALLWRNQPEYKKAMQEIEKAAALYLQNRPGQRTNSLGDTIPVVFHVLYNNQQQNISDLQILSQLDVLNEDFNRRNPDASNTPAAFLNVAGNPQVYFCLASLDPEGKPTNGITRTQTNQASFEYTENKMKFTAQGGRDAWDRNLYLNIWICNLTNNILGFAQFPGGPAATDGVTLLYRAVGRTPLNPFPGPYNRGRTGTHEVGHWLGLRHIWGEADNSCTDSDLIEDTPNQDGKSSGCPVFPRISCNNGPNGDMFMNYMDYTNDACMNLFTLGQVDRMNAVLHTSRTALLQSNTCSNVLNADFRAVPDAIFPGETTDFFYYSNGRQPTTFSWVFEGGTPRTSTEKNPQDIRYDAPGAYTVTLTVTDAFGSDTETKIGYLKVTENELQLYPNPADRTLTIGAPADQKLTEVGIFNSIGQLIRKYPAEERTLTIEVRDLPKGLYVVRGVTNRNENFGQLLLIFR
ncbi:PKD domain-containing protein [Adhaeribacter sp. BT258]|uniref:PKD domain-containing protein n=1 Tax=Adhaeribacter terrigena TaxID=2793070 RepID=A0ABS1C4V5_9BACT|nr:M43 family zinc metalloprotease [Adhaeribacter terrigena]MBK0403668.1 PKD domain-containing protein [Adhaeribacter terrigena]